MNKTHGKNAQGALEYLLIIGAALIVSAIVIVSMTSTSDVALTHRQNPDSMFDGFKQNLYDSRPIYLRITFDEGENQLLLSDYDGHEDLPDEILLEDLFKDAPVDTKVTVGDINYTKIEEGFLQKE